MLWRKLKEQAAIATGDFGTQPFPDEHEEVLVIDHLHQLGREDAVVNAVEVVADVGIHDMLVALVTVAADHRSGQVD